MKKLKKQLIVAIVGMAGSGKSELTKLFQKEGFQKVRFGDITDEEIKKRNWEATPDNERIIREELRKKYGMAAYAILNLPKIEKGLKENHRVVIDGLYSWEEYIYLKNKYKKKLVVLAIYSSPETRYRRLANRRERRISMKKAKERDYAEIENINKAGPIAMADWTIINESDLTEMKSNFYKFLKKYNS